MPPGSYSVTAKATAIAATTTSTPVLINILGGSNAQTPANFKIAFIGDQGLTINTTAVLNLIKTEGAQAVVISGDLDYGDNPVAWDSQLTSVLGANFPVLALIGNHDDAIWYGANGYQKYAQDRFNRLGITWTGDLGVQSSFHYKGIFFVFTSPGIDPPIGYPNNHAHEGQ